MTLRDMAPPLSGGLGGTRHRGSGGSGDTIPNYRGVPGTPYPIIGGSGDRVPGTPYPIIGFRGHHTQLSTGVKYGVPESSCPSLNIVMCWAHSRSSARGPGWPAALEGLWKPWFDTELEASGFELELSRLRPFGTKSEESESWLHFRQQASGFSPCLGPLKE